MLADFNALIAEVERLTSAGARSTAAPVASGMGFREWWKDHKKRGGCPTFFCDFEPITYHSIGCLREAHTAGARSTAEFVGICVRCDAAITREEATRSTAAEGRTFEQIIDGVPANEPSSPPELDDFYVSKDGRIRTYTDEPSSPPTAEITDAELDTRLFRLFRREIREALGHHWYAHETLAQSVQRIVREYDADRLRRMEGDPCLNGSCDHYDHTGRPPTEREKAHEALDAYLNAVESCQLRNCDCVRLRINVDNAIIVAVAAWKPTEPAKGEGRS